MSAPGQAVAPCWNCDQVVQATASTCLWCGVAVRPTVTPIVVAPGGMTPAPVAAPSLPAQEAFAPAPYVVPQPAPKRAAVPLSDAFSGTSSGVGAQVGAFTIDVVTVAVVAVTVHLSVGSTVMTVLALAQALVFLWVLEARTGLTVGHLLLRIRSSRVSAPYSPGAGRAFLRQSVLNVGLLVGLVGAWVVAGSGAWDGTGQRRSLAARASGTLAVTPPKRVPGPHTVGAPVTRMAPGAIPATAPAAGLATPRVVSTSTLNTLAIEDSQSVSMTGPAGTPSTQLAPQLVTSLDPVTPSPPASHPVETTAGSATIAPVPGMADPRVAPEPAPPQTQSTPPPMVDGSGPAAPLAPQAFATPETAVPQGEPAPPAPVPTSVPAPATGGALLLVFDTGQRATLAVGTAINLGRKPSALDPTDQLVAVEDPEGTVSKLHARLEHSRGQTWVTDQGSTNGTDILDDDGVTHLEPGVRTLVGDGMRTRLGNRSFTVSVLLDPTPSPEIPT